MGSDRELLRLITRTCSAKFCRINGLIDLTSQQLDTVAYYSAGLTDIIISYNCEENWREVTNKFWDYYKQVRQTNINLDKDVDKVINDFENKFKRSLGPNKTI